MFFVGVFLAAFGCHGRYASCRASLRIMANIGELTIVLVLPSIFRDLAMQSCFTSAMPRMVDPNVGNPSSEIVRASELVLKRELKD